ncbi:hypothetical protein POM88_050251 [Heracleum sosnowskyi]|uniref:Uncharacterized protein n=1 Tax=Heracleum sosnowskyi TaxID=360622 RepID=A0AAD8GZS4_9APIA|nr:hypothetical protein POM88_050251 [Heracleum sosnowskyi]
MAIPTDCSWILKSVLKFRPLARRFLSFAIGNGNDTSLWFDPVISQANSSKLATINSVITSGSWTLPRVNSRRHHLSTNLISWLTEFNFPQFDMEKWDVISWNDIPLHKLRTGHIWDAVRSIESMSVLEEMLQELGSEMGTYVNWFQIPDTRFNRKL